MESLIDVDVRSELLVLNDVEVLTEPDVLVEALCDIDSLDAVEAHSAVPRPITKRR